MSKRAKKKPDPANTWSGTGYVYDGFAQGRNSTSPPTIISIPEGIYVVKARVRIVPITKPVPKPPKAGKRRGKKK